MQGKVCGSVREVYVQQWTWAFPRLYKYRNFICEKITLSTAALIVVNVIKLCYENETGYCKVELLTP